MSEQNKLIFSNFYYGILNYLILFLENDHFDFVDLIDLLDLFIRVGDFCVRIEKLDYAEYLDNNLEVFEKLHSLLQ